MQVPHLTTALTGPLLSLEKHLLDHQLEIERWFRHQFRHSSAPIYASVDVRNAGFKLAPIDMNLFPAGFNNLNPDFMSLCIQAAQITVEKHYAPCNRIVIVPESHTRNVFYHESLAVLRDILIKAGFEVRLGSLRTDVGETGLVVDLPSGKTITLERLKRYGDKVGVDGFIPCLVWLNNDLSEGCPDILSHLSQKVSPPTQLGWHKRLKSTHFGHYQAICQEFSDIVEIDPWLIQPLFRQCGDIDFSKREGIDALVKQSEVLFSEIKKKYQEYGVAQEPFLIVKADAGTYGMAVMTIRDPEELRALNRKQRTRMSQSKGRQAVTKVIMQEGVYSFETWHDAFAEPVVYMMGSCVVGGFYRVHKDKKADESLNAPGMHFEPLAFEGACNNPDVKNGDSPRNRFYAYGVIARLSLLAAAREIKEILV